jgi:hypothetical protein
MVFLGDNLFPNDEPCGQQSHKLIKKNFENMYI